MLFAFCWYAAGGVMTSAAINNHVVVSFASFLAAARQCERAASLDVDGWNRWIGHV